MPAALSELQKDQHAYSCSTCDVRCCFTFFFPTALLRFQARDNFVHEFPYVEFRLVEIGNFGRVQPVERLLKRKHRPECVALVELGVKHWNAGINQTVLNMRKAARADRD